MERLLYADLLKWKKSEKRKPLVLKGVRQVGKTWLLNEFGIREFSNAHYINFEKEKRFHSLFTESLGSIEIIRILEIQLKKKIDVKTDFLIFDEIQECPAALTSLKYFNEEMPELALGCAGSHMGMISGLSSYPVGKVDSLTLHPLNYQEYINAKRPDLLPYFIKALKFEKIPEAMHQLLWEELKNYYLVGGMPEAISIFFEKGGGGLEACDAVRKTHFRLIEGFQSDFAKHSGSWNASHISRVWESIPEQITRVMDASVSRFLFKGVIPNKSKFSQFSGPIDWLVKTGLALPVYLIEQPAIPLRSRRKPNKLKLYLFDTGLLGTMANIPFESILKQDYGTYKGYMAENYTAQELIAAGHRDLFSWQGRTSEIEFLLTSKDRIIPVEVKSGTRTRARSLEVYRDKYDPPFRVKISARSSNRRGKELNIPLYCVGNTSTILMSVSS
jgi:predicted AAA+ superfamily ATPase